MRALHISLVPATALVLALSGCAAGATVAPSSNPTTVTLFHIDGGPELDPAVDWFAERVDELSDGALTVEIVRSCCGEANDLEERLVAAVADGDADLGWVGTRVLGDLGVSDLAAMTAPMLIDDYALQQAAATSDEATQALAALDGLGVVGLAVMPGSLRVPLTSDAPVLSLSDWQGRVVASFHSTSAADGLRALGAAPLDVGFKERDEGLYDGSISTLENSFLMLDTGREQIVPYATTNLVLWPRSSVLIANPTLSDRLSEEQSAIIEQAARDVVDRTDEYAELDEAAITTACADGARFAEASESDLAAMRDALAGSYAEIADDPAAAPLYEAIVQLKQERGPAASPAIPDGCTGAAPAVDGQAESGPGDVAALDGVFETPELTEEHLLDIGMPAQDAKNAAGTFTFTFDDGTFALDGVGPTGVTGHCDGGYTVDVDRVTITVRPGGDCGPGGLFFSARFTVDDASLTLTEIDAPYASDALLFSDYAWTRIE